MKDPSFPTKGPERGPEKPHTEEEILALVLPHVKEVAAIEDLKGKIERRVEDERGLRRMEIRVTNEETGEVAEYLYLRAGNYPEHASSATRIDVVYYDADGMPISGARVAVFDKASGSWK